MSDSTRSCGAVSPSEDHCDLPRNIVLCFDGTNGQYNTQNTNVVQFFGLLRKDCIEQQVPYYQAGIGTYFAPGVVSPLFTWLASLLDEAFAWYLDAHVMGGYMFLMDNYRSGDKICLFGFSRGAYTARALAGMLTKVGLLPRDNLEQIDFAYKTYKRTDKEGIELAAGFKQTFSRDVKVEFVGVWDTVESTGVLVSRQLPFTDTNTSIKVFRQALSLDEHRSRFQPNLYHLPVKNDEPDGMTDLQKTLMRVFCAIKSAFRKVTKKNARVMPNSTQAITESVGEEPLTCTDVLEVWFSGCHSDVGGGSVRDDVKVSLGQISLHWMVEQVIQSGCGILFDNDELTTIGFKFPSPPPQPPVTREILPNSHTTTCVSLDTGSSDAHQMSKANQPTPNSETYPEHSDAIAPLFDQLEINKLWWLLEIIPSSNAWQDSKGVWHSKWSVNLGRGRLIPSESPRFHHTVKERMDYKPLEYKPRAVWDHDEVYV